MNTKKNNLSEFNNYEEYLHNYFPELHRKSTIISELNSEEIGISLARIAIAKNKKIINRKGYKITQQSA